MSSIDRDGTASPALSVTVMNYNYGRFLEQNITSVLSQSFDDFELLLIDNASTDDSVATMRRYAELDPRIRIVAHETNLGMFGSLRESVALSRGRYRVPIEADDWVLAPDAFEVQVDLLERHRSMAFVYSQMVMIGTDGDIHHVSRAYPADTIVPGEEALEQVLSFALTHSGMMMRVDALRATKGYSDAYPHVADMALAVQLCALGDVGYIDRPLYGFRQHGANLHFRPQLEVMRREVLPVIDEAFEGPLGTRVPDAAAVRRRVTQRALVHLPTQYIFSGQPKVGWRLYWESCKVDPAATVLQPRTLSLVSRTLAGRRGHDWLLEQAGRARRRLPTSATTTGATR